MTTRELEVMHIQTQMHQCCSLQLLYRAGYWCLE